MVFIITVTHYWTIQTKSFPIEVNIIYHYKMLIQTGNLFDSAAGMPNIYVESLNYSGKCNNKILWTSFNTNK